MNKRRSNVLHVSDQAKEFVDEMSQWSGIDRKTIADRVFSWLGHQPRELQAAILMSFPQAFQQDFAELMLKRLSQNEEQLADNDQPLTLPKAQATQPAPKSRRYAAKDAKRYSPGTKRPSAKKNPKTDQDD